MPVIVKQPNPNYLSDAVSTFSGLMDTASNWKRNAAMNEASLAAAAKSQAESTLLNDQVSNLGNIGPAFGVLMGNKQPAYNDYNFSYDDDGMDAAPPPQMDRAGALSMLYRANPSNFKTALGGIGEDTRNQSLAQAMDWYGAQPDSPTKAATMADIGNNKSVAGNVSANNQVISGMLPGGGTGYGIIDKRSGVIFPSTGYGMKPIPKGSVDPRGKLPTGYQWSPDGTMAQPIPGTNEKTAGDSAKIAMLSQGLTDLETAEGLIYNPDGTINRKNLAMMEGAGLVGMSGVPMTESRQLYSLIYNAIEGKLRAESGAAVPDSEVTRMAKRFIPSSLDDEATVRSKLDRLKGFMGMSLEQIYPAGVPADILPDNAPVDITGMAQEQIDSLPAGTKIIQNGRRGVIQ